MDDKSKVIVGGLAVGLVLWLVLRKSGGSGATILQPQQPDTSALTSARASAFNALTSAFESFGLADLQSSRDITLANIQAGTERYRISAAERTASLQAQNAVQAIKAQNSGNGWRTAGQFVKDVGQGVSAVIGGNRINFGPRYGSSYGGVSI